VEAEFKNRVACQRSTLREFIFFGILIYIYSSKICIGQNDTLWLNDGARDAYLYPYTHVRFKIMLLSQI